MIQQIVRMVTSISLCCKDISIGSDQILGCLAVISIGCIGNYSVLIVIVRCFASFHFLDPLSVSVITVLLDHSCFSVFAGDRYFAQTVLCIISIRFRLSCLCVFDIRLVSIGIIAVLADFINGSSFFFCCCL